MLIMVTDCRFIFFRDAIRFVQSSLLKSTFSLYVHFRWQPKTSCWWFDFDFDFDSDSDSDDAQRKKLPAEHEQLW